MWYECCRYAWQEKFQSYWKWAPWQSALQQGNTTPSITTLSILTSGVCWDSVYWPVALCQMSLCRGSCFLYCNAECRYAECHLLGVIMLSVIMLNVIMLSVMVPENELPLVFVTGMKRSDITNFEVSCIFKFQNSRKIWLNWEEQWQRFLCETTHNSDSIVLTLTISGQATQTETILFMSHHSEIQGKYSTVAVAGSSAKKTLQIFFSARSNFSLFWN